jgi:hypothetical protein
MLSVVLLYLFYLVVLIKVVVSLSTYHTYLPAYLFESYIFTPTPSVCVRVSELSRVRRFIFV